MVKELIFFDYKIILVLKLICNEFEIEKSMNKYSLYNAFIKIFRCYHVKYH